MLTRRVIMATGRDGTGRPNIPDFVAGLPKTYWAHSSEASTSRHSRASASSSSASAHRRSTMRPRLWKQAPPKCGNLPAAGRCRRSTS